MIHRETPSFKASLYAPNPKEVSYWVDLKEGPDGQVIKTFDGKEWVRVNDILNDDQYNEIAKLKERCTNLEQTKLDKDDFEDFKDEAEQIHEDLDNSKQDVLVSGLNIKTINGESLLGKGNIAITLTGEGGDIDLSNYATTSDLALKLDKSVYEADKPTFATKTELNSKQDTLVSGTNIKTINGQSLLGNGNIEIESEEVDLSNYYTKTEVDGKIPTVPTNVSAFTNDAGYITNAALSDYAHTSDLDDYLTKSEASSTYATESSVNSLETSVTAINQNITNLQESVTNIEGSVADLDNYVTDEELTQGLAGKQNTLVSGTSIKTINGQSLLGSGNITIETPESGITDAPSDGTLYGRQDGAWTKVTMPDTSDFITETDADSKYQPKGSYLTSVPSEYITESELNAKNYATTSQIPDVSDFVTEAQVDQKVANLVNSAPETLDTLDELAAALGDDPNFATTVANQIGNKLDISTYTSDKANFALKTEIPDTSNFITKTTADSTYQPKGDYLTSIPSEYVTEDELSSKGYITSVKTINNDSIKGTGNLQLCEYETLTFSELKTKADGNNLITGGTYCISDYQCAYIEPATNTERVESVSNWQIIVRAISSNSIAPEAQIIEKGTNKDLGFKLVWFSINKEDAYWTKTVSDTNFKGVILRLIDKNNNDLPYDFKHLRFARYAVNDITQNTTPGSTSYTSAWRYLNPRGTGAVKACTDERAAMGAGRADKDGELVTNVFAGTYKHLWARNGGGTFADYSTEQINEFYKAWKSTTNPRKKYLAMFDNNEYFVNDGTDTPPIDWDIDFEDIEYFYTFDKNGEDASEMYVEDIPYVSNVVSQHSAMVNTVGGQLQSNVFIITTEPVLSSRVGVLGSIRLDYMCKGNTFVIQAYGPNYVSLNQNFGYIVGAKFYQFQYNVCIFSGASWNLSMGDSGRIKYNFFWDTTLRCTSIQDAVKNIIIGMFVTCEFYNISNNLLISTNTFANFEEGNGYDGNDYTYDTRINGAYGNIFSTMQYCNLIGNYINSNTFYDYYNKGITILGRYGYNFTMRMRWGILIDYNLLGLNTDYNIQRSHFGPGCIYTLVQENDNMSFCAATSVFNNQVDNVYFVGYQISKTMLAKAENRANKQTQLITNTTSASIGTVADAVTSTSVDSIQVVSSLPSSQEEGVLYLVTG